MGDSGPKEGVKGVVEDVKGTAKEAVGAVTGNEDLEREGEAQQSKADAQRDAAAKEAEAEKARSAANSKGPSDHPWWEGPCSCPAGRSDRSARWLVAVVEVEVEHLEAVGTGGVDAMWDTCRYVEVAPGFHPAAEHVGRAADHPQVVLGLLVGVGRERGTARDPQDPGHGPTRAPEQLVLHGIHPWERLPIESAHLVGIEGHREDLLHRGRRHG
jgi:uncharacterized protein YjbJ (UPF0337 family)